MVAYNGDGTGEITLTTFSDPDCGTADITQEVQTLTVAYVIGAETTVDGSVADITIATEFDLSFSGGAIECTVIALSFSDSTLTEPDSFTLGNTNADATLDGTTNSKRPTTLESVDLSFLSNRSNISHNGVYSVTKQSVSEMNG